MGRPAKDQALSGAARVRGFRQRLKASGGRRIVLELTASEAAALDALKAAGGHPSDAATLKSLLAPLER